MYSALKHHDEGFLIYIYTKDLFHWSVVWYKVLHYSAGLSDNTSVMVDIFSLLLVTNLEL